MKKKFDIIRKVIVIILLSIAIVLIFCEENDERESLLFIHFVLDKTIGFILVLVAIRISERKAEKYI